MSQTTPDIQIPAELLPADGRFASGPSKVRPEAVSALADIADGYLGTSHRKSGVKDVVHRLRSGLDALFDLPEDWEVVLGNGGTTLFWDAATFGLVRNRSQHLSFGEFSSKFAKCTDAAPFLADPVVIESAMGSHPIPVADERVDLYALTHNETSTGVTMAPVRPAGANDDSIIAVDATSAAGAVRWDTDEVDCYYFAPQKALASDGGLWIACCSPKALDRIAELDASGRWIPPGLSLQTAVENSVKDQTYNTPALATIFLTVHQVEWFNENGGMDFAAGRSEANADVVYGWADASDYATPFVAAAGERSPVVATIDFDDAVSADTLAAVLRANGMLDTEGYRKLGRNQLRIALFPAIDAADLTQLTQSIDYIADQIRGS